LREKQKMLNAGKSTTVKKVSLRNRARVESAETAEYEDSAEYEKNRGICGKVGNI
jgi:hypothetical protein